MQTTRATCSRNCQSKRAPCWQSKFFLIMVLKNWRNSWMCRQKVHRWHLLWIWKVKERKYVAPSVYLLAWQMEIIANPIQPGFFAESGYIVPPWMPRPSTLLALLSEQKRSLWLLMGCYLKPESRGKHWLRSGQNVRVDTDFFWRGWAVVWFLKTRTWIKVAWPWAIVNVQFLATIKYETLTI